MGVQLLDRSGRVVRATDAGEIYLRHVQKALSELQAGERAVRDVQDLSSGELRLGFTPNFAVYLLGPVVHQFRTLYPGVTLRVTEIAQEAMEEALAADALDIGIAFSGAAADDLEEIPLHFERLSLLVGSGHPALGRGAVDATALASMPLALLSPAFVTRVIVDRYFRQIGVRAEVAIEANSVSAVVDIVRLAGLATILPETIARAQAGLHIIRLEPEIEPRRAALLWRRDGYHSAAARAFAAVTEAYTLALKN
jgi:LysR family cyn operon transcriptional activator